MKLSDKTQADLQTYRDLQVKIFKLAKQCLDENIPKIDKLRIKQDAILEGNQELDEYLIEKAYNN
jgi:hypothetical protein